MRNRHRFVAATTTRHRIALLLAALACACGSPTAPRQSTTAVSTSPGPTDPVSPTTPLSPSSTRFNVRGTVRDADGTPIPNAIVQVQYGVPSTGPASNPPSTCFIRDYCWFAARTDSSGAYDAVFDARQATVFLMPGIAATITALHYSYGSNTQIIPFTQTDVVQNFWIRKPARISAGQSTSVIIDSDSSRCQDGEDLFVLTSRCAYVEVEMTEPGTLVVAARSQVGATPTVYWATSGDYAAPVNRTGLEVSLRVNRGVVTILVGIPAGMPTQRVDVTTTFQ